MNSTLLQYFVIAFGAAIVAACVWAIVSPSRLIRAVRKVVDQSWGLPVAVAVRVVLGIVFLLVAPETRYPVFFKVLAVLFLAAAVVLPFVGRERAGRLLAWVDDWPDLYKRLWMLLGIVFGLFIVYCV